MKTFLTIILCTIYYSICFCQTDNCGFKVSKKSKIDFLNQFASFATGRIAVDTTLSVEVQVVFHVIHDEDNENISDERILKELSDLNRDFQLLNTDTSKIPANLKGLVGNPNIKFKLATIDPSGNPTSGIIRKKADRNVYTFKKAIFFADEIWNPKKYMNVYIGNIRNGRTRGYVNSYPWQNMPTDAICLYYSDVGNSTRLLTHETGHWFGLWHIIEGGCGTVNDGIQDTPKQNSFTRGCPTTKAECGNDCMFPNYMDYSSCRVAFTKGQAQRIQEVILKFRPFLLAG
jgi:Pregnancy-associated plasma protein-A